MIWALENARSRCGRCCTPRDSLPLVVRALKIHAFGARRPSHKTIKIIPQLGSALFYFASGLLITTAYFTQLIFPAQLGCRSHR